MGLIVLLFGLLFGLLVVGTPPASDRPPPVDRDHDGMPDCIETAGLASPVDGSPWTTDPADDDTDDDGVPDGEEVVTAAVSMRDVDLCERGSEGAGAYPWLSDPTTPDSDADGVPDGYELSDGSSALQADSDGDGLDDDEERGWGSDPNLRDSDDDGLQDGLDIENGLSPVAPDDDRIRAGTWREEFQEGLYYGDFKDVDTVPQLIGSLSADLSSTVPVVGWVTGVIVSARDVLAGAVRGDWVAAGYSGLGAFPYAGDSVSVTRRLATFIKRFPATVNALTRALAGLEKVPPSVRIKLINTVNGAAVGKLRRLRLTDEDIVRFAGRGADLQKLAKVLERPTKIVHGLADEYLDSGGYVKSWHHAVEALRAYAVEVDPAAVDDAPVYFGNFRTSRFKGGRNVDVCSSCSPVSPDSSVLRFAQLGSRPYSRPLQVQIDQDGVLMGEGYIVEWHFFPTHSGSVADPDVLNALEQAGIPFFVHLPE